MSQSFVQFSSRKDNPSLEGVEDIDPKELLALKANVVIIDVRKPDEFSGELGHIAGAKMIVLDTLPDNMDQIPKDKTIVFVCRSGNRSGRATEFALEEGYEHVYNMAGGMLRWNELGLPVEGRSGV